MKIKYVLLFFVCCFTGCKAPSMLKKETQLAVDLGVKSETYNVSFLSLGFKNKEEKVR